MSKEFSKQIPKVTPTFQSVLIKEIGDMMDALNERNLEKAYEIGKTLVSALKPKDRDELEQNDIAHIESLLKQNVKPKSKSFYRGLIERSISQERVLLDNVRKLFRDIMEKLHRGNYLEKTREIPVGRET